MSEIVEFLEKFKEFCSKAGGRVMERRLGKGKFVAVSCFLPVSEKIRVVLEDSDVEFSLAEKDVGIKSRVDAKIRVTVLKPRGVKFSRDKGEKLVIAGDFDQLDVEYDEKRNEFGLLVYEKWMK